MQPYQTPQFRTMEGAAAFYNSVHWSEDCNPISVLVGDEEFAICGPTTGGWIEANNLEVVCVIDGVTFAVTRED